MRQATKLSAIVLTALLATTAVADNVDLQYAALSLDSQEVGTKTDATLTMSRMDGIQNDPWAEFHCYELRMKNPYVFAAARAAYKPFNLTEKLTCSSMDAGAKVKCRFKSRYIIQFWYEELDNDASNNPVQQVKFSGLQTPQSSQVLKGSTLVTFSDSQCKAMHAEKKLPAITILPRVDRLTLSTGNNELGNTNANNTLEMVIPDPDRNLAKGTIGQLEVRLPSWYRIGLIHEKAYQQTTCSSPCMNFQWAWAHSNTIYLKYKELSAACRKDKKVKISCRGYRNPISPRKMETFVAQITTFDNERNQKQIAILDGHLDTDYFTHVLIPNDSLQIESVSTEYVKELGSDSEVVIDPLDNGAEEIVVVEEELIDTYKVMLYLPVSIPMEKKCWIRVMLPKSLSVLTEVTPMSGFGIFQSVHGTNFEQKVGKTKQELVFNGCNSYDGIGAEPYGRLVINNVVKEKNARGRGGHFRVEIFSDEELSQLIARIDGGPSAGIVKRSNSSPVTGGHTPLPANAPVRSNARLTQMNKILGDFLLKKYMAEARGDVQKANALNIKADAMIAQIRELKDSFKNKE